MHWLKMKWTCSSCLYSSKNAHLSALQDYGMLINKNITNAQAQRFLQLNNRHTIKRMLMANCSRKTGVKRSRDYQIFYDVNKNARSGLSNWRPALKGA